MNFGTFDVSNAVNSSIQALLQGKLGAPVSSLNNFLNKMGNATSVARVIGREFAKESVLQKLQGRGDPTLAFDWIGFIIDPAVSTSQQLPWQYIDGLDTPSLTVNAKDWHFNGQNRRFASDFELGTVNIKIYSDINGIGFNYANAWARATYRQDGYWNLPSRYKKDIQIFLLDAARGIVVDFRLVGCFVTSWNSYQLGASNDILETSLTLSVDQFYMNYDSDYTAAKDSINSLLTGGLNSAIKGLTSTVSSAASSAINTVFSSTSDFIHFI